jgi:hypothetical protein
MTFEKDPDDILDYGFDWEPWLNGDTIVTSVWTLDPGITQDSETETTTLATIWLSGGTDGEVYKCENRIVTAAGRQKDQSFYIAVVEA